MARQTSGAGPIRRRTAIAFAALAVVALACDGAGQADPGPTSKPATNANLPGSMAALGDSITAGVATCLTLVSCTRNSWSTGQNKRVDSHYHRILAGNPKIKGRVQNFAEPGAGAEALAGQADQAVAMTAEYVTILIGANDACAADPAGMTSTSDFRRDVTAGLRRLKKGLPKARVLVAAIPDLHRLWEVGRTDHNAVDAWTGLGICPSMLADPTSTSDAAKTRRRQVADRVNAYNRELRAACRAYGGRCRWVSDTHDVRFSLDMLNELDYFHPNTRGQAELADATYPTRFTWR
jgi:lysophospholipase L1-like esterase